MAASTPFGHPAAPLELDKLDLSFNPDRPAFDDPTPSVLDGQWHDAATKLDLAKAYQEMGDTDGAREILQEVLHEGDDQQKSEAQGLLAKLAS
jgi:pilus assembly protein FimV